MLDKDMATAEDFKKIDRDIKDYIESETAIALASPEPPMTELGTDVIVTDEMFQQRGCRLDSFIPHPANRQNYNV